jgi:hypothetical protein
MKKQSENKMVKTLMAFLKTQISKCERKIWDINGDISNYNEVLEECKDDEDAVRLIRDNISSLEEDKSIYQFRKKWLFQQLNNL